MAEARSRFWSGRHAGVLVPLFSIPSRRSWGIGEIPDLVPLARWLAAAGLDFVQFLPMNEMQAGQSSPYSALSAMAIDPIYISVESVEDWKEDAVLAGDDLALLDRVRRAERVDYAGVRALKGRALRQAFSHFRQAVAGRGGDRDRRFARFASGRTGGSATTRCSAPCSRSTAAVTGASGTPASATAFRRR